MVIRVGRRGGSRIALNRSFAHLSKIRNRNLVSVYTGCNVLKGSISLEDRGRIKLETIALLVSIVLSISAITWAGEEASQKPEDWDQRLEMFRSVPYIGYSEALVEESDTGVVLYDLESAYNGYNLCCARSTKEAFLLDMYGKVVHRWAYPPELGGSAIPFKWLGNGDLIIGRRFTQLMRLNWDSELLWKKRMAVHHDIAQDSDGSFYVIVREVKDHRKMKVGFDAIVHMTADGKEVGRWSTYDHLAEIKSVLDNRSFLDTVIDSALSGQSRDNQESSEVKRKTAVRRFNYNYFHMNTISLLPANPLGQRDARFKRGNLLICFRNVNQIAILERDTYRVLWAWGEGELEWPHHPTMLQNGHILVFDNGTERRYSRVVELDPVSKAIVWEYTADPPRAFYSPTRGSAQRLPNGNTLICESDNGRAFEVTEQGEVVWVWLNPILKGRSRQIVYRMLRVPPEQLEELHQR